MRAYLVDVGVLLSKDHPEFESYCTVYNKKYGYYDEGQFYAKEEQEAIEYAKEYVTEGVENTYAVVSQTELDDDVNIEETDVEYEEYILDNVIFSIAKINGELSENFLEIEPDLEDVKEEVNDYE